MSRVEKAVAFVSALVLATLIVVAASGGEDRDLPEAASRTVNRLLLTD